MAETIYFQWQNQALLDTIYPMRAVKLRDFLLACFEMDIWQNYKEKKPTDIASEITTYCDEQVARLLQDWDDYARLQAYFLDEDVTDQVQKDYLIPDADILARIHILHKSFKTYYPNYKRPAQQKYFISARVSEFEELHRAIQFQINDRQRVLRNMGPTWAFREKNQKLVEMLSGTSIKMVKQELDLLKAFLTAFTRLDQYKQQISQIRDQKEQERATATAQLNLLKAQEASIQAGLEAAARQIQRMQAPPDQAGLMAYFITPDVTAVYQKMFTDPDPDVMLAINQLHAAAKAWLPGYKNPLKERYYLAQRVKDLEDLRARKQQELASKRRAAQSMPPDWVNRAANDQAIQKLTDVTLKMLENELNRLADFVWAYDQAGKQPVEIQAWIEQARREQAQLNSQVQANHAAQAAQNAILQASGAVMQTSERDQLSELVNPARVTVAEIVRAKIEVYKNGLMRKTHQELLEEVVALFTRQPGRFPLWVQYMVIHFSGMRYQTAHGSWADPKDLLLSLRTRFVGQEIQAYTEPEVNALCEQKYYLYKSVVAPADAAGVIDGVGQSLPLLANARQPEWRVRVEYHLARLAPASHFAKRGALRDLRVDEENYAVDQMTDQQVYDELEGLKDAIPLPDWMWKEIVQVTQLRLKEVTDANWEKLSQADLDARWAAKSAAYRQVMDDWKAKHLTGWRKEHELTEDLIVSRAVCNEVAEHIQHVRGNRPGAGLSARPGWYMAQERGAATGLGFEKPYFVKVRAENDLRPGASILYLRWVSKMPDPWNRASPLSLRNGEDLIRAGQEGASQVTNTGSAYMLTRTVQIRDANGQTSEQNETAWLRWMHEATIMAVADTVDGRMVYTFETALPFDDRRQAAIGVFKHTAAEMPFAGTPAVLAGVLCGYAPEGKVPYEKLRDKLNWNHILLREAFTAQQLDELWAAAAPQAALVAAVPSFGIEVEVDDLVWVEAAPPLKQRAYVDWITCWEPSARGGTIRISRLAIQLPRGMRLLVDRAARLQTARGVFYQVRDCNLDPRADGLFVRAADVIEVSAEPGSRPARLKQAVTLRQVARGNRSGKPVLAEVEVTLPVGTRLRLSTVHCAGAGDAGDGLIQAADGQTYFLVAECPRRLSAQGLLLPVAAARFITEKEYRQKALLL